MEMENEEISACAARVLLVAGACVERSGGSYVDACRVAPQAPLLYAANRQEISACAARV